MSTAPSLVTSLEPILCYYVNKTNNIEIGRITNVENWDFERVVRPGEYLLFDSYEGALLEIHVITLEQSICVKKLSCCDIKIQEELIDQLLNHLS